METILESRFKKADHLGNLDDVGGEKIKAPNLNTKRGSIAGNEGLFIKGLNPTRTHDIRILHGNLKYSEPLGYLISLTFPLPLPRGDG